MHSHLPLGTLKGEVKVVLTASSSEERGRWLNELRLRITSPQELQKRLETTTKREYCARIVHQLEQEVKKLSSSRIVTGS